MVLFAIIAIFDHYYKFCDVFKMIFERKTIRNVHKISYQNCQFLSHLRKSSTGSQGQGKNARRLGYKIISLFCDYFTCGYVVLFCNAINAKCTLFQSNIYGEGKSSK